MTKAEFDKAAEGLPFMREIDLSAEVVHVEPVNAAYFRDNSRQRCIVRKGGKLFVANYD